MNKLVVLMFKGLDWVVEHGMELSSSFAANITLGNFTLNHYNIWLYILKRNKTNFELFVREINKITSFNKHVGIHF